MWHACVNARIYRWQREEDGFIEILLARHRSNRELVEGQFRDMYVCMSRYHIQEGHQATLSSLLPSSPSHIIVSISRYHAEFTPQLECETWRYVFDVSSSKKGEAGGRLVESGPLPEARSSPGFELPTVGRYVCMSSCTNALMDGFVLCDSDEWQDGWKEESICVRQFLDQKRRFCWFSFKGTSMMENSWPITYLMFWSSEVCMYDDDARWIWPMEGVSKHMISKLGNSQANPSLSHELVLLLKMMATCWLMSTIRLERHQTWLFWMPSPLQGKSRNQRQDTVCFMLQSWWQKMLKFRLFPSHTHRPPVAVVHLPYRVPYQFHGMWTTNSFGIGQSLR